VFDPARDDDHFAFFDPRLLVRVFVISIIHSEPALDYHEEFIFMCVMVPSEWPLKLDQLHVLSVEFTGDSWIPVIVDLSELFLKIEFLHD
jgi:hypothetical protein